MLEIGQPAPPFSGPNQDGEILALDQYKGQWLVLYFYPKDNTSGCTKEAIDFSEHLAEFQGANCAVIGGSPDSEQSHINFITQHDLKIPLLSDSEKVIHKAYGAWGLKKNYGKEYEGVIRSTFLINPEGNLAYKWNNVKVRVKRKSGEVKHVEIVRDKLLELQAS